jgi:hypothetical protein
MRNAEKNREPGSVLPCTYLRVPGSHINVHEQETPH